ncbi:hypothetical protein Daudx_0012 [Candidatus Desulforudis audaxviator]|nr:hypothetical protein Daudx_0012 [Candidatus Desulforudis audaxviator]
MPVTASEWAAPGQAPAKKGGNAGVSSRPFHEGGGFSIIFYFSFAPVKKVKK